MAYLNLESSIATHHKFLRAGPAASWLWFCGLCHCKHGLTDGFIATEALGFLGVKGALLPLAERLVAARLWEVVDGGWQMHDYLAHNKPAEEVRGIMRKRADGGRLGGRPKKNLEGSDVASENNLEGNLKVIEAETLPQNLSNNPSLPSFLPSVPTIHPEEGAEPPPAPLSPPVMTFPVTGSPVKVWTLTEAYLADLEADYPRIDVLAECRKASAWLKANPGRLKTAKGMPAFLVNWLNTGVNSNRAIKREGDRTALAESAKLWREECARLHGERCGNPTMHAAQMQADREAVRT